MAKSRWDKLYCNARKNGATKEEAKKIKEEFITDYMNKTYKSEFNKKINNDLSDFNNTMNDGRYHTYSDL